MISNYNEFLLESMLLESNVIFSDKFKMVLSRIGDNISNELLKIYNKDLPVRSNYLDVTEQNDKISFIPDNKAQEILLNRKKLWRYIGSDGRLKHKESNYSIFEALGYKPEGDESYKPSNGEIATMISSVKSEKTGNTYAYMKFENGKIGVYNIGAFTIYEDDVLKKLWTTNRNPVSVGKGIRAILIAADIKFTNKELEEFVNNYKSTIDKINDKFSYFDIVKGADIITWYNENNYFILNRGTLGNSCMRYTNCGSYLKIYSNNPNVCELVILRSEENRDKIIGRALLWTLKDGKKYLDRKYTVKDSDVNLFNDFAKENGWYSKYSNNSSSISDAYDPSGERVKISDLSVKVIPGEYDKYPYLDTLKFYNIDRGELSIYEGGILLEDTSGGYIGSEDCDTCGGSGNVECYECGGSGEVECYNCEGSGEIECSECDGEGEIKCPECDGTGMNEDEECEECHGKGEIDCHECGGDGSIECRVCHGDGNEECDECNGSGHVECPDC